MPEQNPLEPNSNRQILKDIPRPQKIAVISLALLAVLIIVFWVLQFRAQLLRPLGLDEENNNQKQTNTVDPRTADTDKDGLSDYEELNNYKTSPYLEDTDSDGILDKIEISQGTDPTCPAGKNCGAVTENLVATSTTGGQNNLIPPINLSTSTLSIDNQNDLQGILSGGANAATLRQILISSGVDQTELDKISDEDLMKSYQETLKNQNTQ